MVVFFIVSCILLSIGVYLIKKALKVLDKTENDRFSIYYELLNMWMENREKGKSIVEFFVKNGIKSFAIYGAGELSERFYQEIKDEKSIEIEFYIDRKKGEKENVLIYDIGQLANQQIDTIIITPVYDIESIINRLDENKIIYNRVISLKEIILAVYMQEYTI